jgi:hypothetical protein
MVSSLLLFRRVEAQGRGLLLNPGLEVQFIEFTHLKATEFVHLNTT